jgi:hypothetical protein
MSREPDVMGSAWRTAQLASCSPPTVEKCVLADEHGVGSLASKRREGGVNLATRTSVEDLELQSHGAAGRFHLAQGDLRVGSIGGIDEYGDTRGRRQHFAQQLEPLCGQLETQQIEAGQISPRARQTDNETKLDRVFGDREHDGNRRCCTFGRQRRSKACGRGNDRDLPAHQIGRQLRQAIDLLGPAVVDRHDPVPQGGRDTRHHRGRSQAPRRQARYDHGSSHLGPDPAASSTRPLRRSRRRTLT